MHPHGAPLLWPALWAQCEAHRAACVRTTPQARITVANTAGLRIYISSSGAPQPGAFEVFSVQKTQSLKQFRSLLSLVLHAPLQNPQQSTL